MAAGEGGGCGAAVLVVQRWRRWAMVMRICGMDSAVGLDEREERSGC